MIAGLFGRAWEAWHRFAAAWHARRLAVPCPHRCLNGWILDSAAGGFRLYRKCPIRTHPVDPSAA